MTDRDDDALIAEAFARQRAHDASDPPPAAAMLGRAVAAARRRRRRAAIAGAALAAAAAALVAIVVARRAPEPSPGLGAVHRLCDDLERRFARQRETDPWRFAAASDAWSLDGRSYGSPSGPTQ